MLREKDVPRKKDTLRKGQFGDRDVSGKGTFTRKECFTKKNIIK